MTTNETQTTQISTPAIFRLAFRPFFLLGSFFSVLAIAWWVYYWLNPFQWAPYGGAIWWHAHEMLFGFAISIIAGFLLTAVRTWTGVSALSGILLATLVLLWLTARILMAFGGGIKIYGMIAIVDVSFLVFTALAMAYPVIKVKQWRNLIFVPILLILASFNGVSHWAALTNQIQLGINILHATILLIVLIVAILGGRVIPAFTANTTGKTKSPIVLSFELSATLSIIAMIIIAVVGFDQINPVTLLIVSLFAALANFIRFSRWGIQHTFSTPLLWSLHFSFMFIPIGFLLLFLHAVTLLTESNIMANTSAALHSFTIGGIGGMIIAMISRVTLGHTGRPMKPHSFVKYAFAIILFSALVRIILPTWFPNYYSVSIMLAGSGWIIAFSIYLFFYARMLVTTRADGRPG